MYAARTSDKDGRKRQQAFADTREQATSDVFTLDPNAKQCSTSRAHRQSDGQLWDTGSDLRWHRRKDTHDNKV